MEHWDPQMMLDLYIHNYMIRKNRHTSAEVFAREANFHPKAVAIDPPEGFLSEWWSIFWSAFYAKFPQHTEATEGSSSENAGNMLQNVHHAVMPSPDANYMLQNICPTIQRPGLTNMLEMVSPMTVPRPDIGSLLQSNLLPTMMPSRELRLPNSDLSMIQGETMKNLIGTGMNEQEQLGFAVRDLNSDSQLLSVDQLARMLPSSSNSSLPQERIYKNPQLCVARDNKCGTGLWRSTAADPNPHLSKAIELKNKHADTVFTDSRMYEQECLRLPVRNLNSNSQILDAGQLARLLPSSNNCSHPQAKVHKKPLLSVTRDDRFGTSFGICTSAEPTRHPPKAIQDARMSEQEHFGLSFKNLNFNSQLLDVDQLAPLLPSSTNFSHPQKNKKRQLSVIGGGDKRGTSLKRPTAAEPTHHAPKDLQPKTEPSEAGVCERGNLSLPVRNLNSNSHLLDAAQLVHLLSSSSNCSHTQKSVYKKSQRSVTKDDKCGSNLRRSAAAERTHQAPKAIQSRTEYSDTGSSTSSNSASSDTSS